MWIEFLPHIHPNTLSVSKKMPLCKLDIPYSMATIETKAKYTTYEIYLLHTYFQLHFEQLNNICTLSIRYTQNKKFERTEKKNTNSVSAYCLAFSKLIAVYLSWVWVSTANGKYSSYLLYRITLSFK